MCINKSFFITDTELTLQHLPNTGERRLAFTRFAGSADAWRQECRTKLQELLALSETPTYQQVRIVRETAVQHVQIVALIMDIDETLSIPAYLLLPAQLKSMDQLVMAIHGHGEVEGCIGLYDDYHHMFALALAQHGHCVLCPELRGFGALFDLAAQCAGYSMQYWRWGEHMSYPLVTDGFQRGACLLGDTVDDLRRWEHWLVTEHAVHAIAAVGISYGGDLALTYPVFSRHVMRIFASGTLGSYEAIFAQGRNAPAHCIPGVLDWMDRADIAGLNAPRPIAIHYGELDRPGPDNGSASYNDTAEPSVHELQAIYRAFGAEQAVRLIVSHGKRHEMDIPALEHFLHVNHV